MIELDDATRQLLLQRAGPGPGSRERVLAGLRTSLGPGPGGPDGGHGSPSGSEAGGGAAASPTANLVWGAKVVGLTLALTGAGLGAVGLVGSALRPSKPDPSSVHASRDVKASLPPAESNVDPLAAAAEPEPAPDLEPPPASEVASTDARTRTRATAQTSEGETSASAPTLEAELALLHRAKQSSDLRVALGLLDQHTREFPNGQLARERELLRIDLLCGLDQAREAEAARVRFLARYPDAPVRPKGCPDQ